MENIYTNFWIALVKDKSDRNTKEEVNRTKSIQTEGVTTEPFYNVPGR